MNAKKDESIKKSTSLFLSPSFIASLASLITALGGVGFFAHINNKTSNEFTRIKPTEINVEADSETGTAYTIQGNKSIKFQFQAPGEWIAIPREFKEEEDVPRGSVSAQGYSSFHNKNRDALPCPGANLGALVIKREGGYCLDANGSKGTIQMDPGYRYFFLMNDVAGKYNDNRGKITVYLYPL